MTSQKTCLVGGKSKPPTGIPDFPSCIIKRKDSHLPILPNFRQVWRQMG